MTKWENLPVEIQNKMLERQAEQNDGKRDISVFVKSLYLDDSAGGFNWDKTIEDYDFWDFVLTDQNFETFYEKYPNEKTVKNKNEITIVKSGSCTIADLMQQNEELNQTIKDFVDDDEKIINVQLVQESGYKRFWIYTQKK